MSGSAERGAELKTVRSFYLGPRSFRYYQPQFFKSGRAQFDAAVLHCHIARKKSDLRIFMAVLQADRRLSATYVAKKETIIVNTRITR